MDTGHSGGPGSVRSGDAGICLRNSAVKSVSLRWSSHDERSLSATQTRRTIKVRQSAAGWQYFHRTTQRIFELTPPSGGSARRGSFVRKGPPGPRQRSCQAGTIRSPIHGVVVERSLGPGEYAFANECAPKDAPAEGLPGHPDNRTCVVTPRTDAYESNCHRYSRCDGDHTRGRVQKIKASLS